MTYIYRRIVIFLVTGMLVIVYAIDLGAQESGIDLFINACQNCGWNPNLISSVQVEFEETEWDAVYTVPSSYSPEMLEQMLPMYDGDAKARDESLRLADEARKKRAIEGFSCEASVVFRTKNLETFHKAILTQRTIEGNRQFVFRGLQYEKDEELVASVFWGYDSNALSVNKTMSFSEDSVQLWGRAQGKYATMALASLTGNLDYERFVFPLEAVEQFKRIVQQNPQAFMLVGEEKYDGNSMAKVVEVKVKGKLFQRYWIDPSRGYVCPLIEVYDDKTWNIVDEYRSSNYFLDAKTGLWYPENYEHKKSNPQDASVVRREVYKINRHSLVLNENIADDVFSLDVPERTGVQDRRINPPRNYDAISAGVVSLKKGGLDLDKMDWLQDMEEPLKKVTKNNRYIGLRLFFVIFGVILIIISLLWEWKKRGTSSTIAPLIFVLCFLPGCTPAKNDGVGTTTVSVSALKAVPVMLDFGRARPTDSPVELTFALVNDSEKPVTITGIDSGCGCTVIDAPASPIPPGGKVSVPLKVNLLGRRGDFKSMIRVRSDISQDVFVNLQGNIVADIWYDGQILRCSAEPQQQKVTTVLNLFTAEHHNIAFDFSHQEEGVSVTEMHRNRKDDETQISLSVNLVIGDRESFLGNVYIVPKDTSVLPLLVPISCVRNEAEWSTPKLITSQVSLGSIQCDIPASARIYGDPDILVTVRNLSLKGLTDGFQIAGKICGELQEDTIGSFLTVSFSADSSSSLGSFEGNIRLNTLGNREYVIPLYGSVE